MILDRDRDGKVLLAGNTDAQVYLLERKQSNFCERLQVSSLFANNGVLEIRVSLYPNIISQMG